MEPGPSVKVGERRPVRARERRVFHLLAGKLARAGVTPNIVSVSSIIFSAAACVAMMTTAWAPTSDWLARALLILAAACVQLRLIANLIDGIVAVEGGMASPVGELYNEAPDRVSDALTLVGLGLLVAEPRLAWLGWAATAVALFVAYVRALGKSAGARQHFIGPMAKQQRMAVVTGTLLLLAILPNGWTGWDIGGWWIDLPAIALSLIVLGGIVTAWRRLGRVADDLRSGGYA